MSMLDEQGRKYRLIKKRAYNPDNGAMLNPFILNINAYNNLIQTVGEDIVRANYDQEPVDIKGKLYPHFLTYNNSELRSNENPNGTVVLKYIKAVADTADTGEDYLCMITYGVTANKKIYILDVYYTQEHMEVTEKEAAAKLIRYEPYIFRVESNNGGRGWSRNVETNYKALGGVHTVFKPYTQTKNKEARILSNATEVMNNIYFPDDWKQRFRDYYTSMNEYQRQGKNEHDDAEDATTAIIEEELVKLGVRYG